MKKVLYLYFVVYKTFYRWEWTDVMLDEQLIKIKCLNATTLVAEWYSHSACFAGQSTRHPDIHGGATDSTSSTAGRVTRVTKTKCFHRPSFCYSDLWSKKPGWPLSSPINPILTGDPPPPRTKSATASWPPHLTHLLIPSLRKSDHRSRGHVTFCTRTSAQNLPKIRILHMFVYKTHGNYWLS